jgi:hypothetical protein
MQTKALLVGINKYPDPRNELRGCVNDIIDMEYFISEKRNVYAKQNIKKLTDKQATKKEIVTQIKWLIEGAEPGDQLLFHYSGHGAQVPTKFAQQEKDGLDEIICPYDFDGTAATTLRDKEFAQLFAGIPKGVHFIWVSDSCHAEDLSRDPKMPGEPQYRYFNGQAALQLATQHTEGLVAPGKAVYKPFNGALLSACASHELSADAYINNRFNGAFTRYLIENLTRFSETKNMRTIIDYVNKDLVKNGYDQNPQSEGTLENEYFFL